MNKQRTIATVAFVITLLIVVFALTSLQKGERATDKPASDIEEANGRATADSSGEGKTQITPFHFYDGEYYQYDEKMDVDIDSFAIWKISLGDNTYERCDLNSPCVVGHSRNNIYVPYDKDNLYSNGDKIINSDPMSFVPSNRMYGYLYDKNNVYFYHTDPNGYDGSIHPIVSLESASFEILKFDDKDTGYLRDKDSLVFLNYTPTELNNVDPNKITFIDNDIVTDGKFVYIANQKIEGLDPASTKIVEYKNDPNLNQKYSKYIIDNDSAFYIYYFYEIFAKEIPIKNINNYIVKDRLVSTDGINVFVQQEIVTGADPKTFERIGYSENYYKDKNNVYYIQLNEFGGSFLVKILKGADIETFEADNVCAKDKDNRYEHGNIVSGESSMFGRSCFK